MAGERDPADAAGADRHSSHHMHDDSCRTWGSRAGVRVGALGGVRAGGLRVRQDAHPPQTGETNYVDRDRHAFSFGLGVRARRSDPGATAGLRLDAHAQLSVLPTVTTTKASAADLVGDYTAGGTMWNVGGTLTMGF